MATWGHNQVCFGGTAFQNLIPAALTKAPPAGACLGDQPGVLTACGGGGGVPHGECSGTEVPPVQGPRRSAVLKACSSSTGGGLSEMQVLGPYPRPTEPHQGRGSHVLC